MRIYSGEKNDCKVSVSQTLLKQAAPFLANAVVTGDALDTEKNGTYHHCRRGRLLPRAQRQPASLHAQAQQKLDHLPAVWTSDTECAQGRIEYRELRVAAFDLDTSLFPGVGQVASLTRYYKQKCGGELKQEPQHFILSVEEGAATLVRLAKIGRKHGSVEKTLAA